MHIQAGQIDALSNRLNSRTFRPALTPTWEHYAPVLVAAGAAGQGRPKTTFPITGFWMEGAFTRRSVQYD